MKKVREHLEKADPDRVKPFESGASAYVKKIVTNLKDYDFVSVTSPRHRSPNSPLVHW